MRHSPVRFVDAVCRLGNRIRVHQPNPRFGPIKLGVVAYVEIDVPPGAAYPIAHFYATLWGCQATVHRDSDAAFAGVPVGIGQEFLFRETDKPLPEYDGNHVQVYVADFSRSHPEHMNYARGHHAFQRAIVSD